MKIVITDNLARENIAEKIWIDNIPNSDNAKVTAQLVCDKLNSYLLDNYPGNYYKVVEDNYKLWKGMEELV